MTTDQLEQRFAVAFDLDRADARDRREVAARAGPVAGNGLEGRVVEDDVGRHPRGPGEVAAPLEERAQQLGPLRVISSGARASPGHALPGGGDAATGLGALRAG